MKTLKKIFFWYIIGIIEVVSIISLLYIYDYFTSGIINFSELSNFILVCIISGIPFGISAYAFYTIHANSKLNK